jgi:hypothetical protein
MAEMLAYKMARQHVDSFEQESALMREHQEAMDCRDCEAFLKIGIDAYRWLVFADEQIRRAVYRGDADVDHRLHEAVEQLFIAWLRPCQLAEEWIGLQEKRGFEVDNLGDFRRCEEECRAIVKSLSDDELTDSVRKLRDEALTELRDGQTAEFV